MKTGNQRSDQLGLASNKAELGQGMTEYVIMLCAIVIPLIPACNALLRALQNWYTFVATWVTLPIP